MKSLRKTYTFLTLVVLSTWSCEDYLDIAPETQVASSSVFQTQDGALAALNGIYTSIKLKGMYGTDFSVIGDAASDNGKIPSDREDAGANSDRLPHAYLLNLNANTTSILWDDAYVLINNANTFLENIDAVGDMSDEAKAQAIAEVRIIRAYAYFCLMQVFAQDYNFTSGQSHPGVPIVTATGVTNQPERNTAGEVFGFIFQEFNEALPDLQNSNAIDRPGDDFYFINYFSALSLRAKMYFYITDYSNALSDANQVINSGRYSLVSQYTTGLYPSTGLGDLEFINEWAGTAIVLPESIFQLYINEAGADITTNRSIIDIYTSNNGNAAHAISGDLFDLYEAQDLRLNWYKIENTDQHVFKYPGDFGAAPDDTPYSVIRLTELILMKAEIEARNGQEAVALELVNRITARANASPIASSGNQLIEDIITERRKELAFEGNRLFDLKRLQRGFTRNDCSADICSLDYPTFLYAWPIPLAEFNGNPNMVQNDGY
ncbi:RagB/SusD family nutrient uptake outer membrane protein [Muricauda sp. SCSIO 64092]|uniref:RagB/SusD family nutrient uptake outer membrane protein n=1 Tax=Allomuricauda sp. SCSIO 64092 TaxID=2908842 RepID=UPI001FF200A8|nr:RagB/SusD family nutrient uptake outer membrane protein [Muricauda sp. SCSIO 64092]UOY08311.1 RagB/SusD family nutrient uptake outer membrane protein [Muricauda sp. SCSIO 64092]